MTTATISTRTIARTLAAQRGISLDTAQRIVESAAAAVQARQNAAEAIEPLARQVADARGIRLDQARAAAERLLAEVQPTAVDRGRELVASSRVRARALSAQRGIELGVAQRLLEDRPRRRSR